MEGLMATISGQTTCVLNRVNFILDVKANK